MNNSSLKYIYQCVTNKAKCSIYIIFIVKLFVIGILSIFTFSVIFNQMYYTLDSYINYHVAFLLLIFLSIYIIVSEVLNIFKIAVEIYEVQIEWIYNVCYRLTILYNNIELYLLFIIYVVLCTCKMFLVK